MNVIPIVTAYNPGERLIRVVDRLIRSGFDDIIVMNVGNGKIDAEIFAQVDSYPECIVLTDKYRKGRGRALKMAFRYILENRDDVDGVITVNGYDQYNMDDIIECKKQMIENPDDIILGCRDFSNKEFPRKNRFGNFIMKNIYKFACSLYIPDPLTGMRGIPYKYLEIFSNVKGDMYDYDTNMLLEVKEKKITYKIFNIDATYIEIKIAENYSPIRDALRVMSSIFKYIASSLICTCIDQVLYAVLVSIYSLCNTTPALSILLSTAGARVVSSIVNFSFNKRAVFKSQESIKSTMWRYYVYAILQGATSYFLVYFLSRAVSVRSTYTVFIKIIVDSCIFIVGFQVQRKWVFRQQQN